MGKLLSNLILQSAPTRKHALSLSCVFQLGHFPRSKNYSDCIFLIKYHLITILKKIGAFQPIFNKVKIGFPIVFSNLARKGSRDFCHARKLIFGQMACIYLLNSCGGPRSFDFDIQYLYPIIVTP